LTLTISEAFREGNISPDFLPPVIIKPGCNSKVRFVLSEKEDSYYTVTLFGCSCDQFASGVYPCPHQIRVWGIYGDIQKLAKREEERLRIEEPERCFEIQEEIRLKKERFLKYLEEQRLKREQAEKERLRTEEHLKKKREEEERLRTEEHLKEKRKEVRLIIEERKKKEQEEERLKKEQEERRKKEQKEQEERLRREEPERYFKIQEEKRLKKEERLKKEQEEVMKRRKNEQKDAVADSFRDR